MLSPSDPPSSFPVRRVALAEIPLAFGQGRNLSFVIAEGQRANLKDRLPRHHPEPGSFQSLESCGVPPLAGPLSRQGSGRLLVTPPRARSLPVLPHPALPTPYQKAR